MAKVTNIFVTKKHLDKAFMSIKPQNINLTSELLLNTPYTFENFKETEKAQELIETFKAGNTQKNTILIRGKEKSGKTTLALLLARLMGGALSYLPAKDITSHATTQSKSQALICAFDTKPKDAKSVVILDDLTEMLNYHVRLQGHYNSTLDSLIKSQMKESPDSNEKTKILLIATANETIPFLEKLFSDRVIIIDKHSLEYGEPSNNSITRNEEFWQAITSPP
jgi:archaellum biogenesis ATPase FlaH